MKYKIEILIIKYLSNEAILDEIEELNNWLIKKENIILFKNYVKTDYYISKVMNKYNLENAKNKIHDRIISIERRRKTDRYKKLAFAASIILIVALSLFNKLNTTISLKKNDQIQIGSDKAILTLENGNQVILEEGKKYQTKTLNSNGKELTYTIKNRSINILKNDQIISNILTVPRGGQFSLNLEDGTRVLLNSDSKIKYPIKFIKDKRREVELLYGEAFFDVSSSENHNGSEFIVITKSQKISVLGTKFNIRAYNDDKFITTTLLEGKVGVENGQNKKVLNPNQQSRVEDLSPNIKISDVDVSYEISWINGLFSFNEASLENIMKVLSRWYDLNFIFTSAHQKEYLFSGILERTKSIEDILLLIEKTSNSNEIKFILDNKTIIIK